MKNFLATSLTEHALLTRIQINIMKSDQGELNSDPISPYKTSLLIIKSRRGLCVLKWYARLPCP